MHSVSQLQWVNPWVDSIIATLFPQNIVDIINILVSENSQSVWFVYTMLSKE